MANTELEVKRVPFMGTELMAARDNTGQIWAGIRWICDGMGMNKTQTNSQVEKIKEDKVLSKGYGKFRILTRGGEQDSACLKLDFVPLWLAKIHITPKMVRENPEIADRLIQYQMKAKDVLAAAFLQDKCASITTEEFLTNPDLIIHLATEWKKEIERRKKLEKKVARDAPAVLFAESIKASKDTILVGDLAKLLRQKGVRMGEKKLYRWLREHGYLIKRFGDQYNTPTQKSMELGLFELQERTILKSNGEVVLTKTPRVTGKGQEYFVNLFLRMDSKELAAAGASR